MIVRCVQGIEAKPFDFNFSGFGNRKANFSKNRNYFSLAVYACDPGFTKLGQECFQYHPGRDGIGYREAVRICQLEGGQIYEPANFEQESLVNEFVQSQEEHANYYIGVHDKDTEGNFVYESSGNPVDFVHTPT